ncbi:MAG TPA: T9SS type A sorting domain-containing protein [Ignavibacteria bacterium]
MLTITIFIAQSRLLAMEHANKIYLNKNFEDDKKPTRKEKSFKNQNSVKVFHDAIKRKVHIIARPDNKKEIEFLVFDINGNMVANYKMKAGDRKALNQLKKGSYMYHVFADDEYLTTGKIVFR